MKLININVKSTNTENISPVIICRYCLFLKSFFNRMACIAMSKRLNIKLVVPTLKFVIKLLTQGIQIRGEVPKLALIDSDAPKRNDKQ